MSKVNLGFIGTGGIARSHAFSLNSLKYYYNDLPEIRLVAASSLTEKSRNSFASMFGFERSMAPEDFFRNEEIDTICIFGPNKVHCEHIRLASEMSSVKRIYIEKPLCSTREEESEIKKITASHPDITFQVGFQFLFMTSVREALKIWKTGKFGRPLHFDLKYYHGDYLQKAYRDKRANRLTPAPDGGAMADLGSHAISLLIAFLGEGLTMKSAFKAGDFPDVDRQSDLFSLITLQDSISGAAGAISASRIAAGSGDLLSMELYAEKGAIRFSSYDPDNFEYFLEETGTWTRVHTGSSYMGITSFPSGHVPPGWLRPMIHAHYIFLTGKDSDVFIPGINHALQVQRILRETAEILISPR
jgi:predicted dehydrogenase